MEKERKVVWLVDGLPGGGGGGGIITAKFWV